MLTLIGLFSLLSGGTALILGAIALGLDVVTALASALQIASMAANESDLDAAADELGHIVITLGVTAFLAGITAVAIRARAAIGSKGPAPTDASPPPSAAPRAAEPPPSTYTPPPSNPILLRLRRLARKELLREIRKTVGDPEVVLWEQVNYGDMYIPVRAGRQTAESLGVRPGDIIGYKILEGGGPQKGGALGDLMHADVQNLSPYPDPFSTGVPR
jgi:hypothetical protein